MARRRPVPPGGRYTAKGTISLQVKDHTGRRVKPRDVIATEPASYETSEEAWEAWTRLKAAIKQRIERGKTLVEFWNEWTDEDHWAWSQNRSPQTLSAHRSRTAPFVTLFGHKPMNAITLDDVTTYMNGIIKGGKTYKGKPSQVASLRLMFRDAQRPEAGPAITESPWEEIGRRIERNERKRRKGIWIPAPSPAQIDMLLADPTAPGSFIAWLHTGVATGMRCGELDAMAIANLDLKRRRYRIERQFNHELQTFTDPKYNSKRTLSLPAYLIPILEPMVEQARAFGSPYVFNTPDSGRHYTASARNHYWNEYFGRPGLRRHVGDATMYVATRHYFTTRAVLDGAEIVWLARHLGHKDSGRTLMEYYAKLTDADTADAMSAFFDRRETIVDLDAERKRRAS